MSEELRPCPFCGKIPKPDWPNESYIEYTNRKCDIYSFGMSTGSWNTRPIEDALNKRIAELEAANELHRNINHKVAIALGLKSGDSWHDLPKRVIDLCERKDELEMFVDQLVEAGDEMSDQSYWNENKWLALVKGWKERER